MKDFLEKNLNDAPMLGAFVNQSDEIKVEGFELIKVEERDGKQAINARELHQKLGSKYQFANWIQERIEKYGFVENQDFVMTVSKTGIRQNVIQKDYYLYLLHNFGEKGLSIV